MRNAIRRTIVTAGTRIVQRVAVLPIVLARLLRTRPVSLLHGLGLPAGIHDCARASESSMAVVMSLRQVQSLSEASSSARKSNEFLSKAVEAGCARNRVAAAAASLFRR